MAYKKIIGIYCIINIINHKRYIGASKNVKSRMEHHRVILKSGNGVNWYLQKEYDQFGKDKFEYIILEECAKENLYSRELYFINYYQTNNTNYGYNLSTKNIGALEYEHPPDITQRISSALIGIKGRKVSKEERESTSRKLQGLPKEKPSSSKYVGVDRNQKNKINPWRSFIRAEGKKQYLGSFKTEVEAAMAYNEAALEYFGWKARTNYISEEDYLKIWKI